MADEQITPILVAIARLETKVDALLSDNAALETRVTIDHAAFEKRISALERSQSALSAIKAFLLTVPTIAMGAGVIFTIVKG